MAITNHICKVCGTSMDSTICYKCGWTFMLFPAKVPDVIREFENKRIEVLKRLCKEKENLESNIQTLNHSVLAANNKITQQQRMIDDCPKKADKQINDLKKTINEKSTHIVSLEKEIRRYKQLKDDYLKVKKELSDSNNCIQEQEKELTNTRMLLKELQEELNEVRRNSANNSKPVAFLLIKDSYNNEQVLGLYDGENVFGIINDVGINEPAYQEINVVGYHNIQRRHFSINVNIFLSKIVLTDFIGDIQMIRGEKNRSLPGNAKFKIGNINFKLCIPT